MRGGEIAKSLPGHGSRKGGALLDEKCMKQQLSNSLGY